MQKYKITVAYDGTDFHGWQIQPHNISIASYLQDSFYNTFHKKVKILGASRTDSGVHALGQIALCSSELKIDPILIKKAWNNNLPKSILIRSLKIADQNFHPLANVNSKTYYYHLFEKSPLPFIARYGWFWKFINKVNICKLNTTLQYFIGTHDFRSFCKNENNKSTIKTINSISIKKINKFKIIRIEIKGKSFLRYQIRRMLGTALDIASKKDFHSDCIEHLLKHPSDQQTFTKAKACGLCLRKIVYKNDIKN